MEQPFQKWYYYLSIRNAMLKPSKGKEHTIMTREEIKVYLEYAKVLLAINKIKDAKVDEALDKAIDTFDDEKERHYLD